MEKTNKPICVEPFSTDGAGIKVSFSEQEIVLKLQNELKQRLQKQEFQLTESKNDSLIISGDFIMINEGSQFLRWFIGPFGVGATKLELEGTIKEDGKVINTFSFSRKGRGGFFGGSSKNLLMNNARGIAKDIIRLIK